MIENKKKKKNEKINAITQIIYDEETNQIRKKREKKSLGVSVVVV
jgi:hypothetical protein